MSTKTTFKRIALTSVVALVAGLVSVAPANAVANPAAGKIAPSVGTVLGAESATATATGVVGGQVAFLYTFDGAKTYITTDGKSTIVSATNSMAQVNGSNFQDGAVLAATSSGTATVTLTSNTAGTSVVTVSSISGTTGVRTAIATLTVTWASATNTDLASLSAVILASGGTCAYASTATAAAINYKTGSAVLCIKATNGAGTEYTQNSLSAVVTGNGVTSLTSTTPSVANAAVVAPTIGTDGFEGVTINQNGLSGKAVYTISVTATNADGVTTTTKSTTASLNVFGDFTSIKLSNLKGSIAKAASANSAITIEATDKDSLATAFDWTTVTETIYVQSDKGTAAISADAPDNAYAGAVAGVNAGVTALDGTSNALGTVTVTPDGTHYEKLTIWVAGKNAAGTLITSNKVVVYVSDTVTKSLVLDAKAATTGGMTYSVQALSDPAITGTAYPVVDGETVTFGASAGVLTASSAATDYTGVASVTLYPSQLGSSVILYATVDEATDVTASKKVAIVAADGGLTALVNSLVAKINALTKLVAKIQKKVKA